MPLDTATISFTDLDAPDGVKFDPVRTKVWAVTNIDRETVIDSTGNEITLGAARGTIDATGAGSITLPIPTPGSNPTTWQWTISVDYQDRAPGKHSRGNVVRPFGPFTIDAAKLTRTVTNKVLTSNVATLTTSAAHGLAVGNSVTVAAVDSTFNGTYTVVSVPTATTFTYAKTASNVTSAAATGTAYSLSIALGVLVEEQEVPAEYLTTVTAQLDALVDEAEAFAEAAAASAALAGNGNEADRILPFASGAVQSKISNLVVYPASGASVTLHTITGAGVVRSHQMTHAVQAMGRDGRLQFFVDGEATPSIDVEIGTMYGTQDAALTTATGNMVSTDHTSVSLTGTSTYPGTSSQTMLYPIPFESGLVVKFHNPSVGAHSSPYGDFMFSAIQYEVGAQAGITDTYRLRSASVAYRTPLAGVVGASLPLFDEPDASGHLVYFSAAMVGATNYSYLERPWNVYVGGEVEPSYRGNAEDWWNSGYYFGGMNRYSSKVASVTAANNGTRVFCGAVDLLAMNGGIKFADGLKMACGRSAETKGSDMYETTSFSVGFVALYYADLSLMEPATVRGAPTGVTATAGAQSATVAFTAPADNGGAAITSYTVTSSPGGITATGSASPINVTGLTAGTPYTFTVRATNSAGMGAASSASNSVTPTVAINIADTFNRADASVLGSTSTGSVPWTVSGQVVAHGTQVGKIVSNQAKLENTGSGGDDRAFAILDTGGANYDASIKLVATGASPQFPGLIVRWTDANNYVVLQYNANLSAGTTFALYRKTAGAFTQMGATITHTPAANDVIRVVAVGTNYKAYINGVLKVDVTDATPSTTATKVGFTAGGDTGGALNTVVWDDFSVVSA